MNNIMPCTRQSFVDHIMKLAIQLGFVTKQCAYDWFYAAGMPTAVRAVTIELFIKYETDELCRLYHILNKNGSIRFSPCETVSPA